MTPSFPRIFSTRSAGFSLVEVVVAMGIVTFALLTVIGLFGGVMTRAGDNAERRAMMEAVDALRGHFLTQGFDATYSLARNNNELVYVAYRADDSGQPSSSGVRTLGIWLPPNADFASYDQARVRRWIRARLQVSPSNPAGTNLPPNPANYPAAVLAVLACMEPVARPDLPLPANPRMEITIGVTR